MLMKSFLIKFLCFVGIPFVLLVMLYVISDPFKTLKKFSLTEFSTVNREYMSMELYLKNRNTLNYNSFIFGSSRAGGLNSYQWKSHLPDSSIQFLFQAWSESLTGIYQKISFLDNNGVSINNALILFDIPGSFSDDQEIKTALAVKHYTLSGKSKLYYQSILFYSFIKPSKIFQTISELFNPPDNAIYFDTISNDLNSSNKLAWDIKPKQDSALNKSSFNIRPSKEIFSERIINPEFESTLKKIRLIFDRQKTVYKIIITPAYDQLHINNEDLIVLKRIFGEKNVYNYSGKNILTEDKYNFRDINHFDAVVGWKIINDLYSAPN